MALRFLTAGESHGRALTAILEGLPAGLVVSVEEINAQMSRRQVGYGRSPRMKLEADRVEIVSGLMGGETIGAPVALRVENRDVRLDEPPLTRPRPGHADLAGAMKYGFRDLRRVLERASARETAARVAVGAVCRAFLGAFGISIFSHVVEIGSVAITQRPLRWEDIPGVAEGSDLRCADAAAEARMREAIEAARKAGDTLGGVFEVVALGVPPGLGSYVHWDRKLDGRLAQAVMSIPAVKGVEVGSGFEMARTPGSRAHDEIRYQPDRGFFRETNRAGGMEGGVTNGEPVVVRGAMKPLSTLMAPLLSVDLETKAPSRGAVVRSDVCAVPAAGVVAEAMVAFVLADAFLEKFGGDTMADIGATYRAYRSRLRDL
ncbi:MAG: chorismate synthase [Armatimonadota bacterium]|nr:chorismate synthase [Armatimonadota bacterium]MDR7451052.1 chorismate synthase [Armatimonadota bacterium]MDR7465927.1 chorismate synthase [Armatimonadota bacterium]MDR7493992.1 chorismate synthase [Armatimonadota bacterium]MDR7498442.1 chorismate synthase [Armatimonadota bacterium]